MLIYAKNFRGEKIFANQKKSNSNFTAIKADCADTMSKARRAVRRLMKAYMDNIGK